MDLINAKTEKSRRLAMNQLNGEVSSLIKALRQKIIEILANIEVNIDYPEYEDAVVVTKKLIKEKIENIIDRLKVIIDKSEDQLLIKNGIKVSIVGKPNVGKSSILNMLLNEEKAIVTDIAGTTRDVVEGTLNLNGVYLKLLDTAGVHEATDKVEEIGINKSLGLIKEAELILLVLDNSSELTEEDKKLLELTKNKNRIIIINKIDLDKKLDLDEENVIYISALNKTGLEDLRKKIVEMFNLNSINTDMNMFVNADDIAKIKKCLKIINKIKENINSIEIDMIDIDLREINDILGSIIGEFYDEEILDTVFKNFCLGK
jgi:tRNA modification GTPase